MINLNELYNAAIMERDYPKAGGYIYVSYQDVAGLVDIAYNAYNVALDFPDTSPTQEEADMKNNLTESLMQVDWNQG